MKQYASRVSVLSSSSMHHECTKQSDHTMTSNTSIQSDHKIGNVRTH